MPYSASNFSLGDMLSCSLALQSLENNFPSLESAAQRICNFFYDQLIRADGSRACGLVRCYKTHSFGELPIDLQAFAQRKIGAIKLTPGTKCLTLLGTAGDEPAWNSRHRSRDHQAMPLASREIVERAPMISQLIKSLGVDLAVLLRPAPEIISRLEGKSYGVFHVENAARSPYIPAQDEFVLPREIRSVVGFGGILASGDLYAVILFSHEVISAGIADRFRVLALDVKRVLSKCADLPVFGSGAFAS